MIETTTYQFPTIDTTRLHLRQLRLEDVQEVYELRSDQRVVEFLGRSADFSLEDALGFISKINNGIEEGKWIYWGLSLKNSRQLIGTACIWNVIAGENKAEIGYELLPNFQGNRLIQEAIQEVIKYGFDVMQLRELDACLNSQNIKSLRILERFKFKYIGKMDVNEKQISEENLDMVVYSLLAEEYKHSKN
jgi:[ribosomal protein S5]-alanine N-acetyltransferase